MRILRLMTLFILVALVECRQPHGKIEANKVAASTLTDSLSSNELSNKIREGGLLLTRFKSLDDLKKVIRIKYVGAVATSSFAPSSRPYVQLTQHCQGHEVINILKYGVTEPDFRRARDGSFWDRVQLIIRSPYAVWHKRELMTIERLGRRRPWLYGKGDVAFYDLAETMVNNISDEDVRYMPSEDLSEKGYLNTFNHITAQAMMTSIFSQSLADFVGDVHERQHTELITGIFTQDQLTDLEDGPNDNYVDLINNIYGQELGKILRLKYSINCNTHWTPTLMANYLNDIESYYSWVFQIGFKPFRETDEIVIRFANKINSVINS